MHILSLKMKNVLCRPEDYQSRFDSLPEEYSHLYLAVDGKLCAVICIEDPLREEAAEVIQQLKKVGIKMWL